MTRAFEKREPAEVTIRYLIHAHDTSFSQSFNTVFKSEEIDTVLTLDQTHNPNALVERWVRSVREECLDQLLILNESHLRSVLEEHIDYYDSRRPYRGLE